ncbi:MAG: DUF4175 domain-containing protein [Flavobacteriales bacterium]|nr:hypothetical protein [Flavobacteriales bacterium]MCB9449520.1 DUF4175 domain-containing protein [Flavobacteriales bacterium]
MGANDYDILLGKLNAFVRKYYKNQVIRGGLYAVAVSLGFYILFTISEYFGHFNTGTRTAIFWLYVGGILFVLSRFIFIPLARIYRIGKVLSHEQAASIIGRHFPDVKDKLLNALQLKKMASESAGNMDLIHASILQKTEELRPIPFAHAVNFAENKKYLKYAIPPLAVLLVMLFAAPSVLRDGTKRLLEHRTYFERLAPFRFQLENDKMEAIQHDDFTLKVVMQGSELPEHVSLETDGNVVMLSKDQTNRFHYVFRNLQDDVHFRLSGNGFSSEEYVLKVIPNPIVLNFEVSLDYPAYTGRTDETLRNIGDLDIPAGTNVKWKFTTQNTRGITMRFHEQAFEGAQQGENIFAMNHRFLESDQYTLRSYNDLIQSQDSVTYAVQVTPDQYPSIEVAQRMDSTMLQKWFFAGMIRDDYGFKNLYFHYQFLHSKDPEKSGLKSEALHVEPGSTQSRFYYEWDASQLDVQPGEEISYYFEVWDNDGVHGSKSSRTEKMVFKAPSLTELEKKNDEANKQVKNDLESSIKAARQLQRDMNNLNRQILEKKELGWEETKKMKDLIEQQKELEKKVNDIRDQNLKNRNEQEKYKSLDPELLDKQRQLNELFDKLMTDEMKDLFKEMEKLLNDMNREQMQEMLEKMKVGEKDLEKELDRSLEIFKQLEFEQKLNEVKENMEKLAEQQDKLADQTEEKAAPKEELLKKQEDIKKDFEEAEKKLDQLDKLNQELEKPHSMENMDEEKQNATDQMQQGSEQLEQSKQQKASKSQKNASQSMKQIASKLGDMQAQMGGEAMTEDLQALRALLENLVQLSFDQENLMDRLVKVDRNSPSYVAINQEQKKLKDDAKMIEDSLFALSKRVMQIEPIVNREISAVNMNMEKAMEYLSEAHMGRNYESMAAERQQYVMTSVNNLALLLDEIAQQMQSQMQNQKGTPGTGSCNKPGGMGQKPGMANMKQLQEQLNKQIEQLKKEGQKPGGMGGKGSMSEQLAKLAAQQEAIRNELQKLNQELNKDGKKSLGDMEGLMKQMEETEKDLVNKRLTQEMFNRQQQIMTRLLESEKAERERELDEKRESKEGKNKENSNPEDYLKYKTMKLRDVELLKTVPPTLSPYYKRKINDYFNQYNKG